MADDPPLPQLPEQELLARAIRIKPVAQDDRGNLYALKPVDLEGTPIGMAAELMEETPGLTPLGSFTTIHSFSSPQFFAADVREVLAQVPPELLTLATAFEVRPDTDAPFTGGRRYHRAVTTFYTGELPQSVQLYPVIYRHAAIYPSPEDVEKAARIAVMKPLHLKVRSGKQGVAPSP